MTLQGKASGAFAHIDAARANAAMGANMALSFPVVSYRGKTWRVRRGGVETVLTREVNGRPEPAPFIEVVMLQASEFVSKVYYEGRYEQGSDAAPDCWSVDGKTPDISVTNKQNDSCLDCRWNAWGSRLTESGQRLKACGDYRRTAVLLAADLLKPTCAPMLLRIPPAALASFNAYRDELDRANQPACAVIAELGFDMTAEFPKPVFKPLRFVTDEESVMVLNQMNDPALISTTKQILMGGTVDIGLSITGPTPPPAGLRAIAGTPPSSLAGFGNAVPTVEDAVIVPSTEEQEFAEFQRMKQEMAAQAKAKQEAEARAQAKAEAPKAAKVDPEYAEFLRQKEETKRREAEAARAAEDPEYAEFLKAKAARQGATSPQADEIKAEAAAAIHEAPKAAPEPAKAAKRTTKREKAETVTAPPTAETVAEAKESTANGAATPHESAVLDALEDQIANLLD